MTLESYLRTCSDRCKGCGYSVPEQGCRCPGGDYAFFAAVLRQHVRADSTVSQNDCREHLRGRLKPAQISRYYQIARTPGPEQLLRSTGEYDISTDHRGKNAGKPVWRDEWLGSPNARAA